MALVLIMSLSLILAACGGNNNGNNAASNDEESEPVELIWYTIGPPQKDMDVVNEEINKYTAEKIGVTVDLNMIDWGDYTQKMQVMTASGEPMDIMFAASWSFNYVQNARKGAFMEIDDLLEEYGQGIIEVLDPAFLEGTKVDGHNYGIPANKELPAQEVWRFNQQLLEKYDLDISGVTDLQSLEPLLKVIKENEPNVIPFAIKNDYKPLANADYLISGLPMMVYLDTEDYKVMNVLETPEMEQALSTLRDYYEAGYIATEAATLDSMNDVHAAGTWFADRATTQPFADNVWSTSLGYPIVSTPADKPYIYNWSVMGSIQAISANSEHPVEAMKFLNLLNTDPYLRNLVDSGIEGVHYEKVGDNAMKNLEDSKNYDMPSFSLGNNMILYLNEGDPENKWEVFKEFNDSGVEAPLLGFNFDTSNVTTEIASIQNVMAEYWGALVTGSVDPEEYLPRAIEKFNEAGMQKVLEEAQRQVDEWRANQ